MIGRALQRRPPAVLVLLVDRVRSFLPMLAVAAMAGYTWWLVQSVPAGRSGRAAQVPPSTPDYVLRQAAVERFDAQGHRLSVLRGATMTHYLEGDRLVVNDLRLVAQDEAGQQLVAVAREGLYRGASDVVELRGNTRVRATAPASGVSGRGPLLFESELLVVNTRHQRLSSTEPVRLVSDQGVLSGKGFSHDVQTGMVQLGGRVTGRLQATSTTRPAASAQ